MLKLNISLEKILPLLKNTFLPALVFGAGVIGFYAANPFPESSLLTLHSLFYVLSFAAFLILLYFDSRKPVIFYPDNRFELYFDKLCQKERGRKLSVFGRIP